MNATARYVATHVYPVMSALLPVAMTSPQAFAMLTAIGLQESRFMVRRQYGPGPARGFWQFEMGGVEGVLEHSASRGAAVNVCAVLGYNPGDTRGVHLALEHNDVLAACFARLLLWTDPRMVPQDASKSTDGWIQYLACWRPGRPHPETWAGHFTAAWGLDWPGTVRA